MIQVDLEVCFYLFITQTPKKIMKLPFLSEKKKMRRRAQKQRTRIQAANRAAEAVEALTAEMIKANMEVMAKSAAIAVAKRRLAAAKKAATLKHAETMRKLKSSSNLQASSAEAHAKKRAEAAKKSVRFQCSDKLKKITPTSNTVFGRFK